MAPTLLPLKGMPAKPLPPHCLKLLLAAIIGCASATSYAQSAEESAGRVDATRLPQCPVQSRVIAIVSTGGPDSMAVLSVPGAQGSWQKLVRVGDRFGGAKVAHIGYKRVWLRGGSNWCQINRFLPTTQRPEPPAAPSSPRKRAQSKRLPTEIAKAIHKVGDNEFEVDRSVVDIVIEQRGSLIARRASRPKERGRQGRVAGLATCARRALCCTPSACEAATNCDPSTASTWLTPRALSSPMQDFERPSI